MITALENHLWQSTLFCCLVAAADTDAAKESCGGAAWVVAGRIGEISRSLFASGSHGKPD